MLWGLLLGIAIGFVLSSISYIYQTKKKMKKASTLRDNENEEEEKQN